MPTYTFRKQDGQTFTKRLTYEQFQSIRDGENMLVDDDDNELELVFSPGDVGFVMKDGVTGSWPSKVSKERKFREARRVEMTKREKDNVFKSKLVPNHKGQEAHSWADVKDHVMTTDGALAASTYNQLVAREKSTS